MALEEKFDVMFDQNEILELTSVKKIVEIIGRKS